MTDGLPSLTADGMTNEIQVVVLFLGPARDIAGVDSIRINAAAGTTVGDVLGRLEEQFPRLKARRRIMRSAVNCEFAEHRRVLLDGDELALIPPVSGGTESVWVELFDHPIPTARIREYIVGDPAMGGLVTFEGATRAEVDAEHGRLVRLDYEAYPAMAIRQMMLLANTAVERWSAGRVALVHRLGPVPVGETSVAIAVASPHRAQAFEACRWLIDSLKSDVPIWKKDVFASGFVRWVDPNPRT